MNSLKCANCGYEFENDEDLAEILEIQEKDENGEWYTVDRELYSEQDLKITDNHFEEILYGCPGCLDEIEI